MRVLRQFQGLSLEDQRHVLQGVGPMSRAQGLLDILLDYQGGHPLRADVPNGVKDLLRQSRSEPEGGLIRPLPGFQSSRPSVSNSGTRGPDPIASRITGVA